MKRALLPSVCFAVLSTVAFEETVLATQNKAVESENSYITTVKYVNIEEGFLNLRQQASTTANVIATLIKGTEVIVYTENNGWSKVKVNGKEGYVSTRYLSEHTKEKTIVNASKKITKFVSVSSGKLNMRSEASTSASVLTSLTKGTAVEVISETNGWSKVKVLGKEGYVSTKYLTATQEKSSVSAVAKPTTTSSTSRTTKYVSVTNGTLNMRSGATTSAPVLTSLSKGTAVEVISESNG
ncbi:SH3 domain-containing protein, partial [Metabacillus malikii]